MFQSVICCYKRSLPAADVNSSAALSAAKTDAKGQNKNIFEKIHDFRLVF